MRSMGYGHTFERGAVHQRARGATETRGPTAPTHRRDGSVEL